MEISDKICVEAKEVFEAMSTRRYHVVSGEKRNMLNPNIWNWNRYEIEILSESDNVLKHVC